MIAAGVLADTPIHDRERLIPRGREVDILERPSA